MNLNIRYTGKTYNLEKLDTIKSNPWFEEEPKRNFNAKYTGIKYDGFLFKYLRHNSNYT